MLLIGVTPTKCLTYVLHLLLMVSSLRSIMCKRCFLFMWNLPSSDERNIHPWLLIPYQFPIFLIHERCSFSPSYFLLRSEYLEPQMYGQRIHFPRTFMLLKDFNFIGNVCAPYSNTDNIYAVRYLYLAIPLICCSSMESCICGCVC